MKKNFFHKLNGKLLPILLIALSFLFTACSEKEKGGNGPIPVPPGLSNTPDYTYNFPPADHEFDKEQIVVLPVVNFSATNVQNDVEAVSLELLLKDVEILTNPSAANKFTYRIVASDGFDPYKDRQQFDLYFDVLSKGHLTLIDPYRTYFHELSQGQNPVYAYNVQRAQEIRMYRTVTVVRPDGLEVMFQLNILNHQPVENPNNNNNLDNSFRLIDLITEFITDTPEANEYFLTAADWTSGSQGQVFFTWSDIQAAYYSRDTDRVFFPHTEVPGNMRLRDLVKIQLMTLPTPDIPL